MKNLKKIISIFNLKKILLTSTLVAACSLNGQISIGSSQTIPALNTIPGSFPVPLSSYYSYTQQIFTKSEINSTSTQNITGLSFFLSANTSISNSSSWKVYIGQTNKATFSSNTDWIPFSMLTQVFDGTVVNSNGKVTINFTIPFLYNNIDNLVIAITENTSGRNTAGFYVFTEVPKTSLYASSDTVQIDPVSPPQANVITGQRSRITLLVNNILSTSEEAIDENNIKIYPNPFKDILNIDDISKVSSVKVSDVTGRLVKVFEKPDSTLHLNELKSGVYMVTLEMKDGSQQTIKTIKK